MVWYGMVWYGMVWYGMVWYGMVWYGMTDAVTFRSCVVFILQDIILLIFCGCKGNKNFCKTFLFFKISTTFAPLFIEIK
jgi:hypothetical protein